MMLLDALEKRLGHKPRAILHIGANRGGEARHYSRQGITGYHVEAIPDVFRILKENCSKLVDQHPIEACLHFDERRLTFNVASNSASSSLLDLGRHAVAYPDVTYTTRIEVDTKTIDGLIAQGIVPAGIDVAVLDVQGAELNVLKGGHRFLQSENLRGLVIEVSSDPLYDGGATYLQVCNYLEPFGFYTKEVSFNEDGWADALFVRRYWKVSDDDVPPFYRNQGPAAAGFNSAQ